MRKSRMSIILLFCCFLNQQILSSYGDFILSSCVDTRNITILPYLDMPWDGLSIFELETEHRLLSLTKQLTYLAKTLFETNCHNIYAYSSSRKRLIQLDEHNYVQFFETEIQITPLFNDGNTKQIISSHINSNNKKNVNKGTVLLIDFWWKGEPETIQKQNVISKKLEETRKLSKSFDVVLLCTSAFACPLCFNSRGWLPQLNNVIYYDPISTSITGIISYFNPHLHQILMDLMYDPTFDWRERYTQNAKIKCPKNMLKRSYVYIWKKWENRFV